MCFIGDKSKGAQMTSCGLILGLASLSVLIFSVANPHWIITEEKLPNVPKNLDNVVKLWYRIGLFQLCPLVLKPLDLAINTSVLHCSMIDYRNVQDINTVKLEMNGFKFTSTVVSKIRYATPCQLLAVTLIFNATIFALIGHCCTDYRAMVACGLFLLGGLLLGGSLIYLASSVSEIFRELQQRHDYLSPDKAENEKFPYYEYGLSFYLSGLALVLAETAALLTMSGYMARFPTVEDMVCVVVPGARRKLCEQKGLFSDYLAKSNLKTQILRPRSTAVDQIQLGAGISKFNEEGASLLSAPDICATNSQSISYVSKDELPPPPISCLQDEEFLKPKFEFGNRETPGKSMVTGDIEKNIEYMICPKPPAFDDQLPAEQQQPPPLAFADNVGLQPSEQVLATKPTFSSEVPSTCDRRIDNSMDQKIPAVINLGPGAPTATYQHIDKLPYNEGMTYPTYNVCTEFSQRSMTLKHPKRNDQELQTGFRTLSRRPAISHQPGCTALGHPKTFSNPV